MLKLFKDAFKISMDNIILATPLLLFLLLLNIYLIVAKGAVNALPSAILFYVTLFLMVSAFLAGWLYMIKVAVKNFKKGKKSEKQNESFNLLKEFPVGIAEYIKPFMGFSLLYLILSNILMGSIYLIGMKFIGTIGITAQQFFAATEAPIAMQSLLESMTNQQLLRINYWYLLTAFTFHLFILFTLFWPIVIIYTVKNPIVALFRSILIIFTKPKIILLYIALVFFNLVMVLCNGLSLFNPVTYLIMTLVYFSFVVYVFVLLFLYYDSKIKGNSNSITDGDGQE